MKVRFQIEYKTHFGQSMMLMGSIPSLGYNQPQDAVSMVLKDHESGLWVFDLEEDSLSEFQYRYFIKDENHNSFIEEYIQICL